MHSYNFRQGKRSFKMFTFSRILGKFEITNRREVLKVNLPQLTAYIGQNIEDDIQNDFSPLIKGIKIRLKENEQAYVVGLVLDLSKRKIYFKLLDQFKENSCSRYFYFGNNSAAASQYYLVRETSSLNYQLTSLWNDLYLILGKYDLQNGELGKLIKKLEEAELISLGARKGQGQLNLSKFLLNENELLVADKKNIRIGEKSFNFENFIRLFLEDENKKNRFVLVVPIVCLEDKQEMMLANYSDYLKLVKLANNLGEGNKKKKGIERVCYICKQKNIDVSSEYSTKFSRSGINKLFTTTTKNTSAYLRGWGYHDIYSFCKDCYQKLKLGEKNIDAKFRGKIAGENVFIIPEAVLEKFDYNYISKIKENVDLAFKSIEAEKLLSDIESSAGLNDYDYYSVNLIFYRTDGNSLTVLETIEDVPTFRFAEIIKCLVDNRYEINTHLRYMSLSSIYRIMPVRSNKKGEQLDVGRVLSLYKALLAKEKVHRQTLFYYAIEALGKGLNQLGKAQINNYYNMNLQNYYGGKEDFFIKNIIMSYLVLIKTCQQLKFLTFPRKEEKQVDAINTVSEKVNLSIKEMEKFLDLQNFNSEERALFYLGVLINRVALAQLQKEHKTKPILKKIQFQGMNNKEIYRLYHDVVEKLLQYNKLTIFSEGIMNRFHAYFGSLEGDWPLSEQANIFYLMAGYAYMVGNKAPDITNEEKKVQEEILEDIIGN